ncbi:MAG: hypothetical protein Q7S02_01300, partial [bacterium]|nr:hypothetical protein [bacterium]
IERIANIPAGDPDYIETPGPSIDDMLASEVLHGTTPSPTMPAEVARVMSDRLASAKERSDKYGKDYKRVVSLSVFGDSRFGTDFWKQMPEFVMNHVLAHHALFGGYELWIHHDEHLFHSSAGDVLCGLERRGLVKLVYMPSRPGQGKCERMIHRLRPVWDFDVKFVICRDVDSLPTWRDRQVVEEFIASGCDVGTAHDNVMHGGMMGGLSHFRAEVLRSYAHSFDDFVSGYGEGVDWSKHGADQDVMNRTFTSEYLKMFGCGGGVLEHSLRSRGTQTIRGSRFVTRITPASRAIAETVAMDVRHGSDNLTPYMGSSGYQTALARVFYDKHSPVAEDVRAAEKFASGVIS